jgi:hypothetical protein
MWENLLIVFGSIGFGLVCGWFGARLAPPKPIVVEEYKLEEVETNGFRKLLVKFEDASKRVFKFEFHPSYAHAFSDDMVRYAARAMAPKRDDG